MSVFNFSISTPSDPLDFKVTSGTSLLFVGANGCGKTRLAVNIERILQLKAHRISAHRALRLNPAVPKISEREAFNGLRFGLTNINGTVAYRDNHRWASNASVNLLNDYDNLLQALFAEQNNKALETHNKNRTGDTSRADATKFERLVKIWERLLPRRTLKITGDDITVSAVDSTVQYLAADMSDGERAIFYLVGQTLCAAEDSVIIFDEPELHIHRAIMSTLWDELESARPDCAFIFISHDLEFVASRVGQKYVIREYDPVGTWVIEKVPEETGFSEEITTQILGSRRPILFVEGRVSSLDYAIYRHCYPQWTVIPRSSCENVIHSVVTMRNNAALTRVTCSGIVDADDYSAAEISKLASLKIEVLTVSEIENLFLLPNVARSIGKHEGYSAVELDEKLQAIITAVIANILHGDNLEQCVTRYSLRRIDRILKKIDLSPYTTIADISTNYILETNSLNIEAIANKRKTEIMDCITDRDIDRLMSLYDNKGLLTIIAQHMKSTKLSDFENWIVRIFGNDSAQEIVTAFKEALPTINSQ